MIPRVYSRGGRAIFDLSGVETRAPSPGNINAVVWTLECKRVRLNRILANFEERAHKNFELCVHAMASGDKGRAEMYAGEIALLKKLIGVISYHERALEQTILRLETIGVAGGISPSLYSAREAAGGTGGAVAQVGEEFADGIERVYSSSTVELKP